MASYVTIDYLLCEDIIDTVVVEHLLKIKSKLESTLDELEASAEREKRSRGASFD